MSSLTTGWSETTFVAGTVHLGAFLHALCVCRTIVCAQWIVNVLWLSSPTAKVLREVVQVGATSPNLHGSGQWR